jgi:hypothetical protein
VVDVARPELEEVDEWLDRVDPVVEQRGDLDVAIATNAGFAASAGRPLLSEDAQHAKLRLVETVAATTGATRFSGLRAAGHWSHVAGCSPQNVGLP